MNLLNGAGEFGYTDNWAHLQGRCGGLNEGGRGGGLGGEIHAMVQHMEVFKRQVKTLVLKSHY